MKSVGTSLKVKVTTELLSASFSEASTMSTVTVGFDRVSMVTRVGAAAAGVAGGVGVAARRHRHRAGAVEAVVGREGRRVDQRIVSRSPGPARPCRPPP